MEMTIEEKDSVLADAINEHFVTLKNNPTCLPVEHLNAKGLDFSDTRNALMRLREKGVIISYKHGWGFLENRSGGMKVFVRVGEEDPTDGEGAFEAYEVQFAPGRLSQAIKQSAKASKTDNSYVLHLNKNGDLYREPKEKFCYEMKGKGNPLKILRYFAENPNTNYEQDTRSAATNIGISADQLRKEINKMNSPIKSRLRLKDSLLKGRRGSGYRLNPDIEIVTED